MMKTCECRSHREFHRVNTVSVSLRYLGDMIVDKLVCIAWHWLSAMCPVTVPRVLIAVHT